MIRILRSSLRFALNLALVLTLPAGLVVFPRLMQGQTQPPPIVYTPAEKAIVDQLRGLRSVPDSERGKRTTDIALQMLAAANLSN